LVRHQPVLRRLVLLLLGHLLFLELLPQVGQYLLLQEQSLQVLGLVLKIRNHQRLALRRLRQWSHHPPPEPSQPILVPKLQMLNQLVPLLLLFFLLQLLLLLFHLLQMLLPILFPLLLVISRKTLSLLRQSLQLEPTRKKIASFPSADPFPAEYQMIKQSNRLLKQCKVEDLDASSNNKVNK